LRLLLGFCCLFRRRPLLLLAENPFDGTGHHGQPFAGRAAQGRAVVEAVKHVAHDLVLLKQHRHGLTLVDAGLVLVGPGILGECRFQVLGDADVIHDQAGRLVAEHPVDAGDGLHQAVSAHWLVDVQGVHAGRVEAGQPHVTHDRQPQRVLRITGALGQEITPRLVADVLLPRNRVGRRAGHHDLDAPGGVVAAVPIGAQLDDLVVERHADAPAHAHHHRLAMERRHPVLEVLHQVGGHPREPLVAADQGFHRAPLLLGAFGVGLVLVLQQGLDLGIDARPLGINQLDARKARFVVNRHRGAILHRAADVVDVDVVAEHRRSVHIGRLDGRAGEADEGGVGQGIAQVLCEAVGDLAGLAGHLGLEAILAAVRLVGDDHDVGAIGQRRETGLVRRRGELLQRGEDHAAGSAAQQGAQVLAVLRLHRRLPEQIAAHGEGRKELVVEVVAVGQHHQRGVGHARLQHQQAGVERHQQALARALRVPDHARLAVARRLLPHAGQAVDGRVLGHRMLAGPQRRCHRLPDGMELVVAGDDLDQSAAGFTEHGEMAQQIEEAPLLEHALDQRSHLRHALGLYAGAVGGAPGHEALEVCRQRADPGLQAIGGHQQRIAAKQRLNLLFVGLELVEGAGQRRVLAAGGFEFDHRQRQAVEEHHHVRPTLGLACHHGELLHGEPVVVGRAFEVDQPHPARRQRAILGVVLHIRAFGQQAVDAVVLLQQLGQFRLRQAANGVGLRLGRQRRVQPRHGGGESCLEHDIVVGIALRLLAVRADDIVRGAGEAQPGKLREQGGFQLGFGQKCHRCSFIRCFLSVTRNAPPASPSVPSDRVCFRPPAAPAPPGCCR